MKRTASAVWQGSGKDGKGTLSTQSKVLDQTPYAYGSRFEDGAGSNPEELIAAAHAGCFTMQLSFNIDKAGYTAGRLSTDCVITLEEGSITESKLTLRAEVPEMPQDKFDEAVAHAEKNCPVSKLLDTHISVTASLNA